MELNKEIKIITLDEIAQSFRTKKIFYVFAVVLLFFLIIHYTKFIQLAILVLFNPEKVLPLPVLIPHLLFYFVIPILAVLFGFDIISGEVQNLTMRFLASRFSRESIIIGKYLGELFVLSLTIFLVLFVGTVYNAINNKELLLLYPLMLWIFLSLYAACFLSIVYFISSVTSRTSITLYIVIILIILLLVLHVKQRLLWISPFAFFNYSLSLATIWGGMLRLVLFALVFLFTTIVLFERRDL